MSDQQSWIEEQEQMELMAQNAGGANAADPMLTYSETNRILSPGLAKINARFQLMADFAEQHYGPGWEWLRTFITDLELRYLTLGPVQNSRVAYAEVAIAKEQERRKQAIPLV